MTLTDKLLAARDLLSSFLLDNTEGGFEEITEVDQARDILNDVLEELDK